MKTLINLFPHQDKTASERLIYFGLHYLRHILVITQFVAICVFFFRFTVDQQIVDLKETLSQKDSIVTATQSLVKSIEDLDRKINNAKQILDEQTQINESYAYVFSKIPDNIKIETLEFKNNIVSLQGSSENAEIIRAIYENIKNEKRFKIVTLSNIVREENSYLFSIVFEEFE